MQEDTLYILWTNDNLDTAHNMVFMYATNSKLKGWWQNVTVIIWGAPAKLAATDAGIQEKIKMAQHAGVFFSACVACARNLGVQEQLLALGIEVIPWGEPLTELIKDKANLITV